MEDSFEKRGLFMTQWGLTEGPPYVPPFTEGMTQCEDGDRSWYHKPSRSINDGPGFCSTEDRWPSYIGDISCHRDFNYKKYQCPYRHEQIIDECKYVMLYTTARGCNTLQPAGGQMSCLRFVKTTDESTPYGPVAEEEVWMAELDPTPASSCEVEVLETWSGWCECATPDGWKVIHAVKDASRHPHVSYKKYTCKEECEKPTFIPAIKDAKMAYTTDEVKAGSALTMGFAAFSAEKAAKCDGDGFDGYTGVEYSGTCTSLNSRLDQRWTGNVREAAASRLCVKR